MDVTTSPNRRQRRGVLRFKKLLGGRHDNLSLSSKASIRAHNLERGRELHKANTDAIDKVRFNKLENIESRKIETWKSIGYNAKEIEKLREAWSIITVGKATREEKKERLKILKDVNASRLSRQNKDG